MTPTAKDALMTLAEFHATFGDRAEAVADVLCRAGAALMDFQAELDDITTEAAGRAVPLPEIIQWLTAAAVHAGAPAEEAQQRLAAAAAEIVRAAKTGGETV